MMWRRDLVGQLRLGARIAGALSRIAVDRLEEGVGRSLPRTAQQLAVLHVVDDLLGDFATAGEPRLPPVHAVRLPGVDFESSNCTNFLIEIEFEGGAHQLRALPKTLYAKIPCAELATRAFANALRFWEVEAHFCERIASHVPIRVPRVHAVARSGARFVL